MYIRIALTLAAALFLAVSSFTPPAFAQNAYAPHRPPLDKPLDELTWTTTHNAYAYVTPIARNQDYDIKTQLADGVSALMLDLHEYKGRVYLCHGACEYLNNFGIRTLADVLNQDIMPHLARNPGAIVTLFLEDYVSSGMLKAEFDRVPGFASATFDPSTWPDSGSWPTVRQIFRSNQRLLVFTDDYANAGDYVSEGGGRATVMLGRRATVENYWSLGDTIFTHDLSCRSRWHDVPLHTRQVDFFPGKSWPRLFVMNHFHGVGETFHARADNRLTDLLTRVTKHCAPEARRPPNFIAVDFYHQGDALEYAAMLNHGGLILWEGNDARNTAVCAIPYTGDPAILSFTSSDSPIKGCENDSARSATLHDLKAGSRILISDSPRGPTGGGDWATIVAKRDIERLEIGSFEKNVDNDDVQVVHHGNRGLDGRVSRVALAIDAP